jgi:hypothetical protein
MSQIEEHTPSAVLPIARPEAIPPATLAAAPPLETAMVGVTPSPKIIDRLDALVQTWGALAYIGLTTVSEVFFIELYCRWHGARLLTLDLYSPQNVAALSKIGFVGGTPPSPMSIVAEVLMWSSLGVWAARAYTMITRYEGKRYNPPRDVADYIGTLIRNTSIAAIIITLLNVSKFQVFGQSVNNFEATAGLSFLLGFFGDDAYRLICALRDKAFAKLDEPRKG